MARSLSNYVKPECYAIVPYVNVVTGFEKSKVQRGHPEALLKLK
jgi:hypothetical protein